MATPTVANEDTNALADAIIQRIKEDKHIFWVDPETHAEQHQFLLVLMQERADKVARRKVMEDKIAGSVVLSTLLVVVGLIGAGALDWLRAHLK
jgi:poly(A) polymerase Pap1